MLTEYEIINGIYVSQIPVQALNNSFIPTTCTHNYSANIYWNNLFTQTTLPEGQLKNSYIYELKNLLNWSTTTILGCTNLCKQTENRMYTLLFSIPLQYNFLSLIIS